VAIYRIRTEYEQVSLSFGRLCLRLGLTPDTLTLLSIPASAAAAYALAEGYYWWSLVAIMVTVVADVLDGATARAARTCNRFGAVLDHVADRYTEFIVLTGAALNDTLSPFWAMFAISGMVMSSYVRATAESVGGVKACTVGLVGRLEKFFILVVGLVVEVSPLPIPGLLCALGLIGVLSHLTAVQRILYARKAILNPGRLPASEEEK
jgi:phosphatidylglycerophosphate synthase